MTPDLPGSCSELAPLIFTRPTVTRERKAYTDNSRFSQVGWIATGIFTKKNVRCLGQMLVNVLYMEHMGT